MMKLMVFAFIVALASPSYAASLRHAKAVSRDEHIRHKRAPGPYANNNYDPYGQPNPPYAAQGPPQGSIDGMVNIVADPGVEPPNFGQPAPKQEDSSEQADRRDSILADLKALEANVRIDPVIKKERIKEIKKSLEALPPQDAVAADEAAAEAAAQQEAAQQEQAPQADPDPAQPDTPDPVQKDNHNNNEDDDGDNNNAQNQGQEAPQVQEQPQVEAQPAADPPAPKTDVAADEAAAEAQSAAEAGAPDAQGQQDVQNGWDNGNEDTKS